MLFINKQKSTGDKWPPYKILEDFKRYQIQYILSQQIVLYWSNKKQTMLKEAYEIQTHAGQLIKSNNQLDQKLL